MNLKLLLNKRAICIICLLLLFFIMFIWLKLTSVVANSGFDNEEVVAIEGNFTVSYAGKTIETPLPAEIDAKAGDQVIITKELTQSEDFGPAILFYVQQANVTVYIGDTLMTESDKTAQLPYPFPPSSRWYFFRLPANYDGLQLRIIIHPFFDEYAPEVPQIYTGSKSAFIFKIIKHAANSIFICVPMILACLGALFIGILLKNKRLSGRMCSMALLAIVIGVWKLLESQITQLMTGNLPLGLYTLFSCFYLLPALSMVFLLTYASVFRQWFMHALFWLSAASYVVIQLLQIFGVVYYIQMVSIVHILLILMVIGLGVCFWKAKRSDTIENDIAIYRAIMLLALFLVIDICGHYLKPTASVGNYTIMGLLLAFGYLGYNAVRQVSELQDQDARQKIYQELAFTDLMTGLANRSSFENEMERLRNSSESENIILLMADLNNLKYINDTFGHSLGDDAIVTTAKFINNIFGEYCKCFRIGGDEFCVIGHDIDAFSFKESCNRFEEQISAVSKEKEYPYSIAYGYEESSTNKVDDCLKRADSLMYKNKIAIKNNRISFLG